MQLTLTKALEMPPEVHPVLLAILILKTVNKKKLMNTVSSGVNSPVIIFVSTSPILISVHALCEENINLKDSER